MTYYEVGDIETSSLVTISSDATLKVAMEAMFSNGRLQIGIVEGDELRGSSPIGRSRVLSCFSPSPISPTGCWTGT